MQIEALSTGIDLYRLEVGKVPTSLEDLISKPSGVDRWNGPYLRKSVVPKDPWGNSYKYLSPGAHGLYDVFSLGADGVSGGEGINQDIGTWTE